MQIVADATLFTAARLLGKLNIDEIKRVFSDVVDDKNGIMNFARNYIIRFNLDTIFDKNDDLNMLKNTANLIKYGINPKYVVIDKSHNIPLLIGKIKHISIATVNIEHASTSMIVYSHSLAPRWEIPHGAPPAKFIYRHILRITNTWHMLDARSSLFFYR
jgi:hypothetical protein